MPSISLPLHSYGLRAAQSSTSRLVNCYIEQLPPDAKTPAVLVRSPGLPSWATIGSVGTIEGTHAAHGLLYVVSGGGLYSVTSAGVATFRGAVGSSTRIGMASNDTALVVVSPPNAFSYTPGTTTFAAITDADFTARGAADVAYQGSRMLFREPSSGRFFASGSGSVSAYDALDFATAEGSPDNLVGLDVDHDEVFLPGDKTCEFWFNNGGSGFPYERRANGMVELGCLNGKTVAKGDNSLFLVATDYTVRRFDGYTPVRISTHAIEQWLRTVTAESLRGGFYSFDGHLVYMLTAPEGAFFYDIGLDKWHERSTYGSEPAWNWGHPVEAFGKVLIGSTTSNVIAELSATTYSELSETLLMSATFQPVYFEGRRVFHRRLEVIAERGVGLTSGQGSAPEILLDVSDDGGRTFQALPNRSLGPIGAYRARAVWHSLGSSDNRVYRIGVSDPVKVAIVDAVLTYDVGRA